MSSPFLPGIGDVVADKYRIDGQLGVGGMAVVFGAHHTLLDKPIAVKILSPDLPRLPQVVDRFLTEARAAARVDSPHVARVMDVGTLVNGLPYMVMERLEGCDLEELLRLEKQLTVGDAVDYVLQALQGLAHAHTLGVIHRDLKPANLFLSQQADGTSIIKILDFGIAKLDDATRVTAQGQAVGSPTYMSPEHIRNSPLVDHRTDIWGIGVVLYELLTGRPPVEGDGVGETLAAVLNNKPPSPRSIRPDIPVELDAAIMKCLEHVPQDRFSDVSQLAQAIAPFGTGACVALVDSIEQTLRQQLRRYSGQAIMIKPTPATATMPVVLVNRSPTLTEEAPEEELGVTEDAAVMFPRRKGRRRFWVALALVAAGGTTFGVLARSRAVPEGQSVATDSAGSAPPSAVASTTITAASASVVASSQVKVAPVANAHRMPSAHPSSTKKPSRY